MAEKSAEETHFQAVAKDLEKMNQSRLRKKVRESIAFFAGKNPESAPDADRANISLITRGKQNATLIEPGQMYTMSYHPKHAESLSVYDRYPMWIMLDINKHGNFLGLNLHYLHPVMRARIMSKLIGAVTAKKLRHDTRMRITYGMTKSIAQYEPLQFCIKSYIPKQISSKLVRIQPAAWDHALFFPSELFVGQSKESVWKQARNFRG